ncbi:MAG TPA: 30S ribosomal protein S13 [Thermoplasmata archaeon]|nr:30S ribosomal protein S13 [Thermoplasmata archaeon]
MRIAPKTPKDETPSGTPAAAEPEAVEKGGKKEKPSKGKEGKDGGSPKEGKAKSGKSGAPGEKKERKGKPIPDNPNFRYIVRLAGSDLDGTRATALAITGVHGVGPRIAEVACRLAGVSPSEMIGNVPEAAVDGLELVLADLPSKIPSWMINHVADPTTGETHHFFGADLDTTRRDDVNRMKMIRSYRGVRHERGQKVRGQRTRSNGRTGMAAGVMKKAAKEAAAAAGKEESGGKSGPSGGKAATSAAAPAATPAAASPADKKKV